jgi:hypothetical protein
MVSYILTKIVSFSSQLLAVAGEGLASGTAVVTQINLSVAQGM